LAPVSPPDPAWTTTPAVPPPPGAWSRLEEWAASRSDASSLVRFGRRMATLALRLGIIVARLLSWLAFSVLSVVAVVLPWAFQRVLFLDPLGDWRRRSTRWIERARPDPRPARPWMDDPARRPPRPLRRIRTGFGALGLIVLSIAAARAVGPSIERATRHVPAAYEGQSWWGQYAEELDYLGAPGVVWNPYNWQKVADIDMRYIDVVDGKRRTWRPPPCASCPKLRVWMFGGSTMFGFGQRDEHTIASEFSRIAAAHGYEAIVENHGVSGDSHWEEAVRFAWALTADEPPDLVIFYDGVNDLAGARLRNQFANNADDQPVALSLEHIRQDYHELYRWLWWKRPVRPPGARLGDRPPNPVLDNVGLAARAVRDYERARVISRGAANLHEVPVVWFWQPVRHTRPPVAGEPTAPPENEASMVEHYEEARRRLADDVVDLSDIFDDHDRPLFYDDVHTNEEAARIVAQAMWDQVEPIVTSPAADADGER
jgi:lysophospholipase L1-like esterase